MACGIDIGGTKTALTLFDRSLTPIGSWRKPTPKRDYCAFLDTVAVMVRTADAAAGSRQSVGLALPGVVDADGRTVSVHLPCLNGRRVVADIACALGRPVVHDNDVRAFTLSESRGGALEGVRIGMGVILGTGVAATLCLDGKLYPSRRGVAGEFGHIALPPDLFATYDLQVADCACGAAGCAEQVLSGPGLLRLAERLGARYAHVEALVEDLRAGVPRAGRAFSAYVDCLGYFLSRLTLTLDPETVVLGGGLSSITELYERLSAPMAARLFDGVAPPRVVPPRFGAAGGARGAALLAAATSIRSDPARA
ncbi:MAG: ROK family protein [Gammaproteobacteria bacterium]|nr:ROK family protein [Gammaproteobacteria bacterium]